MRIESLEYGAYSLTIASKMNLRRELKVAFSTFLLIHFSSLDESQMRIESKV